MGVIHGSPVLIVRCVDVFEASLASPADNALYKRFGVMVETLAGKNTFEKPETIGTAEDRQGHRTVQNGKRFEQMAGLYAIDQTGAADVDENIV